MGHYTSDPEVLGNLVKPKKKGEDEQYLSYSENSDNDYDYLVYKIKKNKGQIKASELKANKFEGPLKNISEKSDSEKQSTSVLTGTAGKKPNQSSGESHLKKSGELIEQLVTF